MTCCGGRVIRAWLVEVVWSKTRQHNMGEVKRSERRSDDLPLLELSAARQRGGMERRGEERRGADIYSRRPFLSKQFSSDDSLWGYDSSVFSRCTYNNVPPMYMKSIRNNWFGPLTGPSSHSNDLHISTYDLLSYPHTLYSSTTKKMTASAISEIPHLHVRKAW